MTDISRTEARYYIPETPHQEDWRPFKVTVPSYIDYDWLYASIHPVDDEEPCCHCLDATSNTLELDLNWIREGLVYDFIAFKKQEDGSFLEVARLSGNAQELWNSNQVLLT